ncbi:MAG: hypothetical protein QXK14_02500 [Acidilobaceae archaeon]
MNPAVKPTHGSIVYTVEGLVAQALGIPHPPELIPVIPKYVFCDKSLWSRLGTSFCRVVIEYGPQGLENALTRSKVVERFDGVYGAFQPYLESWKILFVVEPREALQNRIARPIAFLDEILIEVLKALREFGVSLSELGLTGSLAAELENQKVSDIDLVVYGASSSLKVFEAFISTSPIVSLRNSFGGLLVNPPVNVGWRRTLVRGREVSWIGVPLEGELCEPLSSYERVLRPTRFVEKEVTIEPGQETSLLYPPCVKTAPGEVLISFEYNLAVSFYEGGKFVVRGVADEREEVIYLGTRENPGELVKVS